MEKLDYWDINKFLASLWIVLIWFSILLPYLYLKEGFWLYISKDEFNSYQSVIQEIILQKQNYLVLLQGYIFYIALIIFITWIILSVIWMRNWIKRQERLDEKFDKEVEQLGYENLRLKSLTEKETKENLEIEINEETATREVNSPKNTITEPINQSDRINNYIKIEKAITNLFLKSNHSEHALSAQQRIDNRMNVDILFQSKKSNISDAIVEIKYFQTLNATLIKRIADTMNTNTTYYKNKTWKLTVPILIIVTKYKNTPEEISRFKDIFLNYKIGLPDIEEMIVEIISEENIQNLNIESILWELKNRSALQILDKHFRRLLDKHHEK